MSVETSRVSQPGDGDSDGEQTFGYRSADSAAVDGDLDDDTVVASHGDDEEDDDESPVVYGTVVEDDAADPDAVVTDVDDPQPTFTPVDDGPVTAAPATATTYPSEPTLSETDDVPVIADQATTPVAEAPLSSATDIDPNAPLLGDPVGLRASWQQAQAAFVDDPRAAVADAAELVEHTAQTLIGSLQQRQRRLRTQWDNNGSAGSPATAGELSDTEQLRHLMQDYRNLFNQLCQP
jgi:hypothetical protein